MQELGLEMEREYVFNCYALWVVMNAIHSDDGADIADLMGIDHSDVTNAKYIKFIHKLALNKLTDADAFYNIREYFLS